MATTFQAEVEALTNITIGGAGAPTDTQIDNWCTEGAKDIIRRIKTTAPETMPLYATDLFLVDNYPATTVGLVVGDSGGILRFISAGHTYNIGDRIMITNGTGEMAYYENLVATVDSLDFNAGSWFGLKGVYTTGGWTGNETCDTGAPDDTQLTNLPIESGIVLDVARSLIILASVQHKACDKIDERQYYLANEYDSINYRTKHNPAYYFDGKRIFFAPELNQGLGEAGYVRAVVYPSIDSGTDNIGELADFDIGKQHLISIYGAIKTLEFMIATVDPTSTLVDYTASQSSPTVPDLPTYSFTDAELSDVPNSFLNKGLLPIQSLTIPQYNGGSSVGLSTALQSFDQFHSGFSLTELAEDISSLSTVEKAIPVGMIDADTLTDTTISGAESELYAQLSSIAAPNYTQPSSEGVIPEWTFNNVPDFSHIPLPVHSLVTEDISLNLSSLVVPTPWDEQSDTQVDPSSTTPGYEESIGVSWEAVNDALENEDFEEATAHMSKISTRVSNQQQQFSQRMEEYTKEYDRIVKTADYGKKEKWTMELAHWNSKIEHYKMQVADVFTIYTNNLTRETSKWTQLATQQAALFTQEMTNNVNVYNKEVAIYEKKVEAIITDTKNTIDVAVKNAEILKETKEINAINTFKASVDQYSNDISAYNSAVTKYSGDIQYYVERFNAHFTAHTDTWKSRQSNILEEQKSAAVEALNIFNADNVKYQADVQMIVAEFNSEAESLIKKMEVSTDLNTQNEAKHLEAEIQKYNAIMDSYVGEVQTYQHEISYEIQGYAHKIAKEQQDQTSLQLEYTWYQDKYTRLIGEYEASFGAGAPAPPQAAPQGA